jgi:anti-sigma regulatory factor (Ser/Thr protein kinase)
MVMMLPPATDGYAPGDAGAPQGPDVTVELELPGHPDSVARARHALGELARVTPALREDLRLLVSEVVTNAIRHASDGAADHVRLRLFELDSHVRVEVLDRGPGFTVPDIDPDPERSGGWGLWLVEQLADRWGISGEGGTCVWFELSYR